MPFDLRNFLQSAQKPYAVQLSVDLSGRDFDGFQVPAPAACSFQAVPALAGAELVLQVHAGVQAECARCLAPVREEYSFTREYTVRPRDLEDPDFELPVDAQGCLEIEELIYQELIFEVPRVLLCSPDCLGLCPICGKKRAAGCSCQPAEDAAPPDARLSILKQLLS